MDGKHLVDVPVRIVFPNVGARFVHQVFLVAFFGTWCTTVPESWINKKAKTLSWPPKKINPTRACLKNYSPKPDRKHSIKYIKLLGPYETYETARAVEIAAADMSTCDETSVQEVNNNSKRLRRRPSRYQESTSDSSDDADKNNNNEDDEGHGLDSIREQMLPSFNYDGSDNDESHNNMEVYFDKLLESQELHDGEFFNETLGFEAKKMPLLTKMI